MILSVLPGSAEALAGVPLFSGKAKNAKSIGPSFGTIVKSKTADAKISTDPGAQLAALLQNGTPMSTIVDTVVNAVADRVKSAAPQTERLRTALAPPGKAPPNQPAAQQVAALVRKLQTVLKNVTGGMETANAGQQNDIPGKILDAASTAKETPAQAQTAPTPTPVDIGSLVQSILEGAAAALQSGSVVAASVPQGQQPATPQAPGAPQAPQANQIPAQLQGQLRALLPTPAVPGAPSSAPAAVASDDPASDLLSRMLLRATNGSVRPDDTTGGRPATSTSTGTSATFARLVANAEAAAASGSQSGSRDASGFGLARDSARANTLANKTGSSDVAAFSLPNSETHTTDATAGTSVPEPYTTVDTEALLAQMVKGIAVQAGVDGAHQVQLHLQPAHLGNVTLDLRVDGSTVSANVVAQSADVRDALVANQHHLARALADAGLKLSSFSADVSGGDARGFQQQQNNSGGFGRRYVVHETTGTDETDASSSSTGSPNAAGAPLELLNKLA